LAASSPFRALLVRIMVLAAAVSLVAPLARADGAPAADGFAVRGIKGLWWDGIEKYRLALPWLAGHKLNFLMFCYTSFPASGKDWRSDYTAEEMRQMGDLSIEARKLGVNLCLSFNPAIWSNPPLVHSSEEDYQTILRKVKSVHALGINWFALCLDDINRALTPADSERFGNLETAQVYLVNRLWDDMKSLRPRPKLIFCPSAYTTRDMLAHQDYIKAIGAGVARDVRIFWTGPEVCSPRITAADANRVAGWLRRKPFVWDNYPVNDMCPWRPLVGPVRGRAADLAGAVSGFMANPMKQWHASTLPLASLAEYLNDAAGYRPEAARRRVIESYPHGDRRAVGLLFDLYGSSFWGEAAFPPVPKPADRREAGRLLGRYRVLRAELASRPNLAPLYEDVSPTLEMDIRDLERQAAITGEDSGLLMPGDRFSGGGAEVYARTHRGRWVGYVYAAPTGKDTIRAKFLIEGSPPAAAELRLQALNDDSGKAPRISVKVNDAVVFEGTSPFNSADFSERRLPIPAGALKQGTNVLAIANIEPAGTLGMPPWFMVSEAEVIPVSGN